MRRSAPNFDLFRDGLRESAQRPWSERQESAVASEPDLLVFESCGKRYGRHRNGVEALSDVNLSLSAGQVVGLLGHNGSGKTTLLRLACGMLEPDRGRVLVGGRAPAPDRADLRRWIGWCPADERSFYPRLSRNLMRRNGAPVRRDSWLPENPLGARAGTARVS